MCVFKLFQMHKVLNFYMFPRRYIDISLSEILVLSSLTSPRNFVIGTCILMNEIVIRKERERHCIFRIWMIKLFNESILCLLIHQCKCYWKIWKMECFIYLKSRQIIWRLHQREFLLARWKKCSVCVFCCCLPFLHTISDYAWSGQALLCFCVKVTVMKISVNYLHWKDHNTILRFDFLKCLCIF